jgi:geranylgeranyl diphosphate synthase type II
VVTSNQADRWQKLCRQRVEEALLRALTLPGVPKDLSAAMRYSVLGGGKRMRPLLAYAGALAVGGHVERADIAAVAVELIHAYSLIHDDLPAMDDDVLRRGRPTCHIVFGEARAILAGDALQTLAFDLLASSRFLAVGNATRLRMVSALAKAGGAAGMVGGQAIDIGAIGTALSEKELTHMHSLKTGALIRVSVLLGALSSNIAQPAQMAALEKFAGLAGLAFQIQDDILDVTSSTAVSGKQQGKDAALNKPTYVSLLGLAGAQQRLAEVAGAAQLALGDTVDRDPLLQLLHQIVHREA